MKKIVFIAFFSLLYTSLSAQLVTQASVCRYTASEIVDPYRGITMYDNLNSKLGGKNIRYNEDNNPIQGWVEDYYENGKVLHRGYYIDGQLKNFKNYYESGQVERKFKPSNWRRSKMRTFFENGKTRSKIAYYKTKEQKSETFYANGNQQMIEEKNKFAQYYVMTKGFYEDGKIKSVFQLVDKEKLTYSKTEYYASGGVKEQGSIKYDPIKNAYLKEGPWKRFDDTGKVIAEVTFTDGKPDNNARNW